MYIPDLAVVEQTARDWVCTIAKSCVPVKQATSTPAKIRNIFDDEFIKKYPASPSLTAEGPDDNSVPLSFGDTHTDIPTTKLSTIPSDLASSSSPTLARDPKVFFIFREVVPDCNKVPYYPSDARPVIDCNNWHCIIVGKAVGVIGDW